MKNIFLLLLLLTGMVEAQIVSIPDANFKARLLAADVSNTIAYSNGNYSKIDLNNDGEIQVSEAQVIDSLDVNNSAILDLSGIAEFSNLKGLQCANNQLNELNVNTLVELRSLFCASNPLGELNLTGLVNLESLFSYNINLSTLDLSGLTQLKVLEVGDNSLTNLDLSDQTNLLELRCGFNQIANLDLSPLVNLKGLNCNENLLSSLNLSGLSMLEQLSCDGNQLTTLDVSEQTSLVLLSCRLNDLNSLFIKNGTGNGNQLYFDGNPNIQFICADEDELLGVNLLLVTYGYNNCTVNTYCSFQPGGVYNTIEGQVLFDVDSNGCDSFDLPQAYLRMDMTQWGINSATFTNATGNYRFFTTFADQMITPNFENSPYFTVSPAEAIVSFPDTNFLVFNQNFCIAANGIHPDVEAVVSPLTPARPGFDATYQLVYRNKGNQTVTIYPNFSYNESLLDLISSSVTPNQINPEILSWVIPNIRPFESGSIEITFRVNAPTDTPAVNSGDVLTFSTFVDIENTDENWEDNSFTLDQTVVGSYDPNNIICLEGDVVPATEIGKFLHYVINFENTGTFPAENVVVKTEIDATKFNIDSLQLMNSNFPVDARITGNKVEFIFENIQLPIGGHGHVLLKIRTQGNLVTGDVVANRGDIFFDYNFPIDTGLANTVFQTLSNSVFEVDNSIAVYPNPAVHEVSITADGTIKSIELYDVQGRIIMTRLSDDKDSKLDISSHSKGIYFIKIITEKGAQVQKLIKE